MSKGSIPFPCPPRILIVDDEVIICDLICAKLQDEGYSAVGCGNGEAGWERLSQGNFDLAILDLDIPDVDGYSLIERVRTDIRLQHLPIIVLTGNDDTHSIEKAYTLGATSFVTKPVNWSMFGYQVRYVLRADEREKALQEARLEAINATRYKDSVIKILSHELRTPLYHIIGYSELLDTLLAPLKIDVKAFEYLDNIGDAGHRLLSSLTEIMLYSRILSNDVDLQVEEYSAAKILDVVINSRKEQARAKNVRIYVKMPEGVCHVICDFQMWVRVMVNLLDNAIKFSLEGSVVQIGIKKSNDGSLVWFVNDEGIGMSTETLGVCLSPFLQAESVLARNFEGFGIGLPISKAIVELHGGEITITSEVGKGVKVKALMPAERIVPAEIAR